MKTGTATQRFLRFPIANPPRGEKGSNAKRDVAAFCQERTRVRRFHFR